MKWNIRNDAYWLCVAGVRGIPRRQSVEVFGGWQIDNVAAGRIHNVSDAWWGGLISKMNPKPGDTIRDNSKYQNYNMSRLHTYTHIHIAMVEASLKWDTDMHNGGSSRATPTSKERQYRWIMDEVELQSCFPDFQNHVGWVTSVVPL